MKNTRLISGVPSSNRLRYIAKTEDAVYVVHSSFKNPWNLQIQVYLNGESLKAEVTDIDSYRDAPSGGNPTIDISYKLGDKTGRLFFQASNRKEKSFVTHDGKKRNLDIILQKPIFEG